MNLHRWQNQLIAFFFSRFPTLTARWVKKQQLDDYGPPPWTPLVKPVVDCRVALVTTAGVHRKEDTPFNMEDQQGDPTYRIIPQDVSQEALCITHDYYDHRDADKDLNIVLPLDRLREFAQERLIGEVAPFHYSFMGHIDGPHVSRLLTDTAPSVARRLKREQVDAVVLTPA
ncbi:MAG: glycine/sarcosine/betaine reductase selenoprotein B family protein [Candidatus Binatia bacterium]